MVADVLIDRFEALLAEAKRRLRTRDEDAIAAASLRLWESLSRRGDDEDGEHVRRSVNAGRKTLRSRSLLTLDAQPSCGDNLASCAIVDDLLGILPESQRRAFVYHCLDGLSDRATAELLGMSERNVRYLVIKAKRRLWKEMN